MLVNLIDIGSNTVKMSLFDVRGSDFSLVCKESRVCGLISYIRDGKMTEEGISLLLKTLTDYRDTAQKRNADCIIPFATASLRRASNAEEIIDRVKQETGLEIDLISAEREAALSYKAVQNRTVSDKRERGVSVDMGGGSTEIDLFRDGKVSFWTSLPFGCLSLYNAHCKGEFPTESEWDAMKREVFSALEEAKVPSDSAETLYLIGGSARALALSYRVKEKITIRDDNGFSLSPRQLLGVKDYYASRRDELRTLVPERYTMLLPALAAYDALISHLGVKKLTVSASGMREGYLFDLIERGVTRQGN